MSFEPIDGWDEHVLLASEATFGTTPNPAASQALEVINFAIGPSEVGAIRAKKDRAIGRGMTSGYLLGKVQPIPWSFDTSVKSRSAVDVNPLELALYKAAGLKTVLNGGSNATITASATPVESADFAGLSAYRLLGQNAAVYKAEQGRGGIVKSLEWSGGDKELWLKAAGAFSGKYSLGYEPSITCTNVATTLTLAAGDGHRFSPGWYQIESEIVQVTSSLAANAASDTVIVTRAALGSSAVAHTAKALYPYLPAATYTGFPISEGGTISATVFGTTLRILSWVASYQSGGSHLPVESGSKYAAGVKFTRYDMKLKMKLVMHKEDVAAFGWVANQKEGAIALVQSNGAAGGVFTLNLPLAQVDPFAVPDSANDVSTIDLSFRVRDSLNTGNDGFNIVLT